MHQRIILVRIFCWYEKPISVYHEQIGGHIQAFRKNHQLSIKNLSQRCAIAVQQLQRIERGEVNFRLTILVRLMDIFEQDLFSPIQKS